MTTHAPATLTLPAPHDYTSAAGLLHDAHDAVESIEWRLRNIVNAYVEDDYRSEQPPGPPDVCELWSFIDDVDRLIVQLTTKRNELRGELATINLMRRDAG